jgi:hypothetical protein
MAIQHFFSLLCICTVSYCETAFSQVQGRVKVNPTPAFVNSIGVQKPGIFAAKIMVRDPSLRDKVLFILSKYV